MFVVVGYGNTLRGDDAAGPRVLDHIDMEGVRSIRATELTPELAEDLGSSSGVVFVDAREGGNPGEVSVESLLPSTEDPPPLTHALSPRALLHYAACLHGVRPRAALVTVVGEGFGLGEGVSARVAAAIPEAARLVLEILEGWKGR